MCDTGFTYILVGEKERHMILCRNEHYIPHRIQRVIRETWPELIYPGAIKILLRMGILRVSTKVTHCHKDHSSQFDFQVLKMEKENDWQNNPYVALQLVGRGEGIYCEVVNIA